MAQSTINLQSTIESGTWTPDIPRINITKIVSATWTRVGRLVFATAILNLGTSTGQGTNLYLNEFSLPLHSRGIQIGVFGALRDGTTDKSYTAITSTTNNNVWFNVGQDALTDQNAAGHSISLSLVYSLY